MFPTPPSQPEHNPIASPCGPQTDNPSMEGSSDVTMCIRKGETYSGLGSPTDDVMDARLESNVFLKGSTQQALRMHHQDWSYVFKPATVYKMLGSSKYSPLPELPSQKQPSLPLSGAVLLYKASWQSPPSPAPTPAPPATQAITTSTVASSSQPPHQLPLTPSIPNAAHLRPGLSPISPVTTSLRGNPIFRTKK